MNPNIPCGQIQKDEETGNYELLLCERCKSEGYCRKLAGENIEPYFPMKCDEEAFKNVLPIRIPKEKQCNQFLVKLNEAIELFHQKEYEQSLVIFRELYQQNSANEIATYGVACCCYFLGDFDEAASYTISSSYSSSKLDFVLSNQLNDLFKKACNNKISEKEWQKEQEEVLHPISNSLVGIHDIKIDNPDAINIRNEKHFKALIHAFEQMNIISVNLLLDDTKTYEDFTKDSFLSLLHLAFETFRELGDNQLIAYKGGCNSHVCGNYQMPGYRFEGNHSGAFINVIFEYLDTGLNDICECNDFASKRSNINPENRIFIDTDKYGFDPDTDYFPN